MKAGVCSTFRLASLRALSTSSGFGDRAIWHSPRRNLQAHVGVRGNGEDQRVDRRLAGEVLGLAA